MTCYQWSWSLMLVLPTLCPRNSKSSTQCEYQNQNPWFEGIFSNFSEYVIPLSYRRWVERWKTNSSAHIHWGKKGSSPLTLRSIWSTFFISQVPGNKVWSNLLHKFLAFIIVFISKTSTMHILFFSFFFLHEL